MMTRRRSEPQGDLLAEDPPANSPDDLGFGSWKSERERPDGVDDRPPNQKAYGKRSPGPDPVPENVCESAIQILDARKFVTWIHDQDLEIHEDVTVGHVLVGLSGLGTDSLAWLCRACRQAGRAPAPAKMRAAAMKRDVALLRAD